MARFWWRSDAETRNIHWTSWEKMCWPKSEEGLNFRDLYAFNLALLAKQGWRLLHNLDSLVGRVLKAKCYPDDNYWNVIALPHSSYA